MDLPINDKDLDTIVNALSLGGDARLYHLLKEVKEVRERIQMDIRELRIQGYPISGIIKVW